MSTPAPHPAATFLAESLMYSDNECGAIFELLDSADDDTVWQRLSEARERLRALGHHHIGTSIGLATDFGVWHTKDGWEPASTHPMLSDHET